MELILIFLPWQPVAWLWASNLFWGHWFHGWTPVSWFLLMTAKDLDGTLYITLILLTLLSLGLAAPYYCLNRQVTSVHSVISDFSLHLWENFTSISVNESSIRCRLWPVTCLAWKGCQFSVSDGEAPLYPHCLLNNLRCCLLCLHLLPLQRLSTDVQYIHSFSKKKKKLSVRFSEELSLELNVAFVLDIQADLTFLPGAESCSPPILPLQTSIR